ILWKTLANPGGGTQVTANSNRNDESPRDKDADRTKDQQKKEDKTKQPTKDPSKDQATNPDKTKTKEPDKTSSKEPDKRTVTLPSGVDKPNDERKDAGRFVSTGAVLARQSKDGAWQRVPVDSTVQTGEALVSLPSYKSELRLDSGVRLR